MRTCDEKKLKKLCKEGCVEFKDCGNGHIQLKGVLLVNYYPDSKNKTSYVAGTVIGSKNTSFKQAIAMCNISPKNLGKTANRGGNSKRKRRALFKRGIDSCYWCKIKLTIETSTLEHIIPLAVGGLDNANNRTIACKKCNSGRGCDMSDLFKDTKFENNWENEK